MAVCPGPALLARQLAGAGGDLGADGIEFAGDVVREVMVACGEAGADGFVVWEPDGLDPYVPAAPELTGALEGLQGQAQYFGLPLVLLGPLPPAAVAGDRAALAGLPVDLVCAEPLAMSVAVSPEEQGVSRLVVSGVGDASPFALRSTAAVVPMATPATALKNLVSRLRELPQ